MDSQRRQTGHAKVEPQWSRRKREVTKTTVSARPRKVALIVGWAGRYESISEIAELAALRITMSSNSVEASTILQGGLCPDVVLIRESFPGGTWGSLVAELRRLGLYPEVIVHTEDRGWRRVLSRGGYCLLAERVEDLATLFP